MHGPAACSLLEGKGESHRVGAATGHCYCWDGRERLLSAVTSLVAAGFDDKDLLVGWRVKGEVGLWLRY